MGGRLKKKLRYLAREANKRLFAVQVFNAQVYMTLYHLYRQSLRAKVSADSIFSDQEDDAGQG